MESFFLSETLKYLYLLFDEDNPVNRNELDYVFSTQGHLFPVQRVRSLIKDLASNPFQSEDPKHEYGNLYTTSQTCLSFRLTDPALPLEESTWNRIGKFVKSNIDTHSPF
ncbi:unnamed protein product [Calicophoron daubneyi]|uniref:Alpha-1,2-Mannosidase n=1 Tax=Calicophoron daubneyi TaxID=300641 RepID=A0AAV2T2B4_CALDB